MHSNSSAKAKKRTVNKNHQSNKKSFSKSSESIDKIETLSSNLSIKATSSTNIATKQKNSSKNNNIKATKKQLNKMPSTSSYESKDDSSKYVLWRRPFQTFYNFIIELFEILVYYLFKLLKFKKLVISLCLFFVCVTLGFYIDGIHLPVLIYMRKKILWCAYWMGLGIASSIGLGTGLHTFLLYLGPFIAQVTMAAYECDTLKFPEPPYPDNIICPTTLNDLKKTNSTGSFENNESGIFASTAAMAFASSISILSIMAKVRLESFMWGAGTAIGELPPYFMARASALSSMDHSKQKSLEKDEELADFENLLEAEKHANSDMNMLDRLRLSVFKIIKKVGFWGILLCASIPNPLFDLAGITCGHFLVRFWTFFGATLIGKAIIKMHIQKLFVIFLFSQHHLDNLFELLSKIPHLGQNLQPIFKEWLQNEKKKLHNSNDHNNVASESILSWVLGKLVLTMIIFFIVSIINSLAQRRVKRLSNSHQMQIAASKSANKHLLNKVAVE